MINPHPPPLRKKWLESLAADGSVRHQLLRIFSCYKKLLQRDNLNQVTVSWSSRSISVGHKEEIVLLHILLREEQLLKQRKQNSKLQSRTWNWWDEAWMCWSERCKDFSFLRTYLGSLIQILALETACITQSKNTTHNWLCLLININIGVFSLLRCDCKLFCLNILILKSVSTFHNRKKKIHLISERRLLIYTKIVHLCLNFRLTEKVC